MKRLRFIHTADLHLGSPFRGLQDLPEHIRSEVRESTLKSFSKVVDLAIEEQVDFMAIAGDIYDQADRSLRAQLFMQKELGRLDAGGIPAMMIHGNHDPLEEGWKASLRLPPSVHVFSAQEVETVPIDKPGRGTIACVHGMSYSRAAVTENLALRYKRANMPVFQLGLLHSNVDGDPGHDNYAPCSRKDLTAAGLDYWALGHIHTRRVLLDEPAIVYAGNIQGRSIRETGPKGCYMVEAGDRGDVRLDFRATDTVRWMELELSIEGIDSEQELRDQMQDKLELARAEAAGRPVLARFIFSGRGRLHRMLQKEAMMGEWIAALREEEAERAEGRGNSWVWIESYRVRSGLPIDLAGLLAEEGFLGDLLRLSGELAADKEELAAFARQALEALLAHPKAGKEAEVLAGEEAAEWLRAAAELAVLRIAEEEGWS
jgi:DNA repair protein SbcD/Mre11